ncbi:hypothetical protein ACLOJK_037823 [Asimina triloba]
MNRRGSIVLGGCRSEGETELETNRRLPPSTNVVSVAARSRRLPPSSIVDFAAASTQKHPLSPVVVSAATSSQRIVLSPYASVLLNPDLHYSPLLCPTMHVATDDPCFPHSVVGALSLTYLESVKIIHSDRKIHETSLHMQLRMDHPPEGGDVPSITEAVDDSGDEVACCGELNVAEP